MERSLTIPSNPAAIDLVEAFLSALAADLGLSEDAAGDLIIAGTEAANNAILHGNRQRPDLMVRIEARVDAEGSLRRLRLEVSDEGLNFRPAAPLDPGDPEHLLDISGRGLYIIRHLMDDVRIETGAGGTRVILLKTLA
jgi:serine/threonine-protein kinase RsbW